MSKRHASMHCDLSSPLRVTYCLQQRRRAAYILTPGTLYSPHSRRHTDFAILKVNACLFLFPMFRV